MYTPKGKTKITEDKIMWTKGTIDGFTYCVKHFDEGSEFGINEGRISKLELRKDGRIVANYDRGWDIKPTSKEANAAYAKILKQYN